MDYLPIFLDVRDRRVIVDGGGTIAARRAERALAAGALVEVYDNKLSDEFNDLMQNSRLKHIDHAPLAQDYEGCLIAYGASEDPERDKQLFTNAKAAGALVNVADVFEYCDFMSPSVVDRSPLVIAISSGGSAPVIARILRARIESLLPPTYGRLAEFVGRFRDHVSAKIKSTRDRRRFWEKTIEGPVGDLFLAGDRKAAEEHFYTALDASSRDKVGTETGEVYLVGAGPGDPDLLTFRALRLMQRADVVLYDRLVGDDILALMRRDAERIYVGKRPQNHTMDQAEIGELMVDLARQGKRVLRLKGGDPFIFGRGGEEIETLAEQGIPFQVVPGITAASGCASYAGIPLTHRDYAQSCLFTTAHGKDGELGLDWNAMLRPNQTVAVYMGLSSLRRLAEQFEKHGADLDTPAAIIDNGTRENQTVIVGTVRNLLEQATEAGLRGPSMIIIGNVVKLHDKLEWFRTRDEARFQMSLQPRDSL